jgi:site-specific recombinase XerD
MRKLIRPAAQKLGIQKRFGWHTFRHTFSTLLRSVGTEFKVMQESLYRRESLASSRNPNELLRSRMHRN